MWREVKEGSRRAREVKSTAQLQGVNHRRRRALEYLFASWTGRVWDLLALVCDLRCLGAELPFAPEGNSIFPRLYSPLASLTHSASLANANSVSSSVARENDTRTKELTPPFGLNPLPGTASTPFLTAVVEMSSEESPCDPSVVRCRSM